MRENRKPPRLSSHVVDIEPSYEVVVVGSGYGGSIAACRLAEAGRQVCVLERGKEFALGEFPEDLIAVGGQLQTDISGFRVGSKLGLFDLYADEKTNVVVGCGLGGTSLINANVSIKPDPELFKSAPWPESFRKDMAGLEAGYEAAWEMLSPRELPEHLPTPAKLTDHERSAARVRAETVDAEFRRVDLNVRFQKAPPNAVGFEQPACAHCGNCASGCNTGAKNTLTMNYLPLAKARGAHIITHAEVSHVERVGDRWAVHFTTVQEGGATIAGDDTQFVLADVVVLGAGTLGSTGILLRSAKRGLSLSPMLGQRFSGNGDQLAFAYGPSESSNAFGWASDARPYDWDSHPVGPTITSAIRLRGKDFQNDVLIEEGAIPVSIARVTADLLVGVAGTRDLLWDLIFRPWRAWATQTYLIMSMDDSGGKVTLGDDGRVRVSWHDPEDQPDLALGRKWADVAARGIAGEYIDNPLEKKAFGQRTVSVHPLGGCVMGDDAASGVVNDECQVFQGETGTDKHEGLYVCDGAVIPSALGVNPLLTISAVAERAVARLVKARESIPRPTPRAPAAPAAEPWAPGLEFDEQMKGWFSPGASDFDDGLKKGKAAGTTIDVRLVIRTEDLARTIESPAHELRVTGVAVAPSLAPSPLTITHGLLNLFYEVDRRPDLALMRYRMRLTSTAGESWWFDGYKHVGKDAPIEAWHDSTTLYVNLHLGPDASAPAWARGRMRIDFPGALRLACSVRALRARGLAAQSTKLRFLEFAGGVEVSTALASRTFWSRRKAPTPLTPPDPPVARR